MENLETTAVVVDLAAARTTIERAKITIREQELLIATEELATAETSHEAALRDCRAAQDDFDRLDGETKRAFDQRQRALTQRNGAAVAIDTHRRNPPTRPFDSGRPLNESAVAEWNAELSRLLEEKPLADAAFSKADAELQLRQGKRRMAGTALEDASWRASDAGNVLRSARTKLARLQPREVFAPLPPQEREAPPDVAVGTLTSTGIQPY